MRIPQLHFQGSTLREIMSVLDQSVFIVDKPGVTVAETKVKTFIENIVGSVEGDFYARRHRSQRIEDLLEYIEFELDTYETYGGKVSVSKELHVFLKDCTKALTDVLSVFTLYYNLPSRMRKEFCENYIEFYSYLD